MMDSPFLQKTAELSPAVMYRQKKVKGQIGIEIELEGDGPIGFPVKGWEVHQENSLRGPGGIGHGGAEYVTAGAIDEKDIIPAVDCLNDALKKNGFTANANAHRSSTHIHLNVQNVNVINIFGCITIFTCIEPMLLALCGSRRDGNSFCASAYDTGDLPEAFNGWLKNLHTHNYMGEDRRGKYAALSTFRLHDLGTLEARCFPQSLDSAEIAKWARWMLTIREVSCLEQDKSYRSIVKQGLNEPLGLATRIFGNDIHRLSYNLVRELITFGSQEAYELTRLLKRYINKKAEPAKKGFSATTITIDDLLPEMDIDAFAEEAPQVAAAPLEPRRGGGGAAFNWADWAGNINPRTMR